MRRSAFVAVQFSIGPKTVEICAVADQRFKVSFDRRAITRCLRYLVMNDCMNSDRSVTRIFKRRSQTGPADDPAQARVKQGECETLCDNGRKSKYISIDAAKVLFEQERSRIALYAIPFKDSKLERPRWTLEVLYNTSPRYIIHSRRRISRPILASTPSGVYGIAAEIGADQVVMCLP